MSLQDDVTKLENAVRDQELILFEMRKRLDRVYAAIVANQFYAGLHGELYSVKQPDVRMGTLFVDELATTCIRASINADRVVCVSVAAIKDIIGDSVL